MGGHAFERALSSSRVSGPERSEGPETPSLDSCSLDYSVPSWSVTLLEFPGKVVEVRGIWNPPRLARHAPTCAVDAPGLPGGSSPESSAYFDAQRELRNVVRAKRNLRHRVLSLGADHMLTLTERGKFASLDDAWSAFSRFSRYCVRFYGDKWRYVCVPERHADGTFHLHVAVKGFFWVGILRKFWYRALGGSGYESGSETPGNIDIAFTRRGRSGAVRGIARYMAKYLGKDLSARLCGRRSYACSSGLVPVQVRRVRLPLTLGDTGAHALLAWCRAAYPGLRFRAREWNVGLFSGVTIWSDS